MNDELTTTAQAVYIMMLPFDASIRCDKDVLQALRIKAMGQDYWRALSGIVCARDTLYRLFTNAPKNRNPETGKLVELSFPEAIDKIFVLLMQQNKNDNTLRDIIDVASGKFGALVLLKWIADGRPLKNSDLLYYDEQKKIYFWQKNVNLGL